MSVLAWETSIRTKVDRGDPEGVDEARRWRRNAR